MTSGDRSVRATMLPTRHAAESRSVGFAARFAKRLSPTRLYPGRDSGCIPSSSPGRKMLLSRRHERKCTTTLPEYCVR
jgi:hypothetical protein